MPKLAANLSMMFQEVDFLDRFAAAAAAGFRGVEFLFPYEFPPFEIAARLQRSRLTQAPAETTTGLRGALSARSVAPDAHTRAASIHAT